MEKSLADEDRELISIVGEDLLFLRDEWDQDVTDASLRRSSVVLRRLLVDKHLGQVWRKLGFEKEPSVTAVDLAFILEGIPPEAVAFAQAGGALHRGLEISSALEIRLALSHEQAKLISNRFEEAAAGKEVTLSRFLRSLAIVVEGVPINREELILYVANKLGGAHFDATRKQDNAREKKYQLLDSYRASVQISSTNGVLFELLSVGQALLRSKHIIDLLYVIKGVRRESEA